MDFNIKKFTSDATTAFNRVVQFTEEKLGKAEKTELDAYFETLLAKASVAEENTKTILGWLECYLQPNPTLRVEEFFYEKLELKKEQRLNNLENLGNAMTAAGDQFGPGTPYGKALLTVGATQTKLGAAEQEFISAAAARVLTPLKRFLDSDIKTIHKERKVLNNKRLDLDACKTKLRKLKSSHSNTITAEADLRMAQSAFDKQCEILRILLEGIQSAHTSHLKCLREFVDEQTAYYSQCHQLSMELQRSLTGSTSGVDSSLCSGRPAASSMSGGGDRV